MANDPKLRTNESRRHEWISGDVATHLIGSPDSDEANRLIAQTFAEYSDVTLLESAQALGDKRAVNKLSNKLEKTRPKRKGKK